MYQDRLGTNIERKHKKSGIFAGVLTALGERFSSEPAIAEGKAMLADAAALLPDLERALARTVAIAKRAGGGPCPFAFVAGGSSCTVADASQSMKLQPRENEPWRTYSELMYSTCSGNASHLFRKKAEFCLGFGGIDLFCSNRVIYTLKLQFEPQSDHTHMFTGAGSVLPLNLTLAYLKYAEANDKAMKLGVLSGSGSSAGGPQLQTFTIQGFGHGLLVRTFLIVCPEPVLTNLTNHRISIFRFLSGRGRDRAIRALDL